MLSIVLLLAAQGAPGEPRRPAKSLDPDEMICRTQPVTGSRLETVRVCLTRAQWKERNRQSHSFEGVNSRSNSCTVGHC